MRASIIHTVDSMVTIGLMMLCEYFVRTSECHWQQVCLTVCVKMCCLLKHQVFIMLIAELQRSFVTMKALLLPPY